MKADDLSRVNAAFFTMNGYVSVLFFLFWAADILLLAPVPEHAACNRRPASEAHSATRCEAGERLAFEDGLALYRTADILALGYLANLVRERLHGNVTYFNVNRHINPTDVCVASCRLCAFGKKAQRPQGVHHVARGGLADAPGEGWSEAVTEFHIVGGLHPELTLDWYCEMLRGLKQRFPQVHLKAFTMVEIGYLARRTKISVRETLRAAARRGHGFAARRRRGDLHRARAAHHLRPQDRRRRVARDRRARRTSWGCSSNCTMLYGHIENDEDRVDHLMRLRALQDETGGFLTFIPLAFHPDNTRAAAHSDDHRLRRTSGTSPSRG